MPPSNLPQDFLAWLASNEGKAALAGAAGGFVRWLTLRDTWKDGLGAIVVGSVCALYLGPLVAPILKPALGQLLPNGDTSGFSAFVVGLGGISFSGFLIDLIKARQRSAKREKPDDKDRD